MPESADDFKVASELIEQHGEGAALVASSRANAMREQGDANGLRRWSHILRMIEKLQRGQAGEGDEGNDWTL